MTSRKRYGAGNAQDAGWREVKLQWRRPRLLEITRVLTAVPTAVVLAEHFSADPTMVGAGAALALHTVADLTARCVRRSRS